MFSENFRTLRKTKGYSQEELAIRLNVVRQTISKWEKGISAPDADMLTKIADIFDVSVADLVEREIETEPEQNAIVDQMSRINEQLIISNHRSLRIWKTVAIACISFIFISIAGIATYAAFGVYNSTSPEATVSTTVHGEGLYVTVSTAEYDEDFYAVRQGILKHDGENENYVIYTFEFPDGRSLTTVVGDDIYAD